MTQTQACRNAHRSWARARRLAPRMFGPVSREFPMGTTLKYAHGAKTLRRYRHWMREFSKADKQLTTFEIYV